MSGKRSVDLESPRRVGCDMTLLVSCQESGLPGMLLSMAHLTC